MKLIQFLKELPAFERFSDDELDVFIHQATMFEFPEGYVFSDVNETGDATYLLIKGRVRVFNHDKVLDKALAVNEICAGEMFNLLSLVEDLSVATTAVALEPTVALKFSRQGLSALRDSSPRIAHQFQYMIAIQLANALQSRNAALRAQL